MNCKRIGLDLAKNVFQLHGVDNNDQVVLTRKLKRTDMKFFFAQLPPCEVAMESCATSHYWARCLQSYGHQVKLLAAQHVKPYLQGGKNDANDAAAICEAASRPHMKYVGVKMKHNKLSNSYTAHEPLPSEHEPHWPMKFEVLWLSLVFFVIALVFILPVRR